MNDEETNGGAEPVVEAPVEAPAEVNIDAPVEPTEEAVV